MPGEVKTYFFNVPEDYGPTKIDPQCITSTYQSFVDFSRDMYSGLVGPLLICKRGSLDGYGRQVRYSHHLCKQYMKNNPNQKFLSKYISPIVTFQIVYLQFFLEILDRCYKELPFNKLNLVCIFSLSHCIIQADETHFVCSNNKGDDIIVIFKTLTNRVLIV